MCSSISSFEMSFELLDISATGATDDIPLFTNWSWITSVLAIHFLSALTRCYSSLGAEECSLAFHEGRSLAALTWVAQQPRQGAARSRADEEADQLAEVAAAYANRCEHVLGSSDQIPGGTSGASRGAVGGRSAEYGSQGEDGFDLLQVKGGAVVTVTCYGVRGSYNAREITNSF